MDEIYLGIWNNWTEKTWLASTLTLTKRDGALLVAFLALFLAWTGSRLWKLCCYAVFQVRSRTSPNDDRDGEYRLIFMRLQATLRNASSALDGLFDFITTARSAPATSKTISKRKSLMMCAPLIIFATFLLAWIAVASLLPSRFISTGSDVRLRPRSCGVWPQFPKNVTNYGDAVSEAIQYIGAWTGQTVQNMVDSSHVNRDCYDVTGTTPSKHCNSPGRRIVNWTSDITDTCPFGNVSCLSTHSLILDSGLVDSHIDLGINARRENRISFRKTMECAIPDLTDYTANFDRNNVSAVLNTPYYHMSRSGAAAGSIGNAIDAYLESVSNLTMWQAIFLGMSYIDNTNATFLWNSQRSTAPYSGLVSGNGPAYTLQ